MLKTNTFLFLTAAASVSAVVLGLSGCGSKDSTTASSGSSPTTCFDYSSYSGTTPTRSFTSDVLPLLQRSCGISSSCHGDSNQSLPNQPYLGPSLSDPAPDATEIAEVFTNLFKASGENAPMPLVTPGDPSKSFMMYKLDGEVQCASLACTASMACGALMPSGNPTTLAANELDVFRSWIKQGAKNDFGGGSGGAGGK